VVRRAKFLLEELGRARRGVELPLAPIHGDYKLGNAVQLSDGSWANLDLDFVRIRERLYDVAASLYCPPPLTLARASGWTLRAARSPSPPQHRFRPTC
jgi:Ser/Thr protein kinase RdoA (MazF antagonist)